MHWKNWCWSWNSNALAIWFKELTHWKRPWYWERLKAGWEGDNRRYDGWMALPTQWTWAWVNSGSWWWTGRPGMLQSMGSKGPTWTELNWYRGYTWSQKLWHDSATFTFTHCVSHLSAISVIFFLLVIWLYNCFKSLFFFFCTGLYMLILLFIR